MLLVLIFDIKVVIKYWPRNEVRKFLSSLHVEVDVSGPENIRDEAGETVPGRTDGHVGEVNLSDGPGLYGGGDGTVCPAREGLLDHDCGSSEASDDDTDPEQSDQPSVCSYVGQTMYGGGLQELRDILHTYHPCCFLVTETWRAPR